jgi:hypothetical protein
MTKYIKQTIMEKLKLTHAAKLERWLGAESMNSLLDASKGFYHPIPIMNVPGALFAHDGEVYGTIKGGGFSSLSDLISERTTGGKGQQISFFKVGSLGATAAWADLWNVGSFPTAGGTPAARPGGAVPDNTTAGGLLQADPGGGDTLHFVTGIAGGNNAPNTLLLYDRIFHASAINHNTAAAQTITGVPTRYATTTSPGNFAFLAVTTVLTATAFTITMQYVDNAGNTAENAAAVTGITTAAVTRICHSPWFIPLNAGDTGLRNCTQITFSAAAASGVSNFVMGHPIAFLPMSIAGKWDIVDGINSAFNLEQILTDACLSFIELKGQSTATTYQGQILMVSG